MLGDDKTTKALQYWLCFELVSTNWLLNELAQDGLCMSILVCQSKWLKVYLSPNHISQTSPNIPKGPDSAVSVTFVGPPTTEGTPPHFLLCTFFLHRCKIWWCFALNLSVWWADPIWLKGSANGDDWGMSKMHIYLDSILGHAALAFVFHISIVKHVALGSCSAMGSCRSYKRQSP